VTLVENEIRQIPAKSSNPQLKREAAYEQIRLEIYAGAGTGALPVRRINEYIKLERKLKPERPRGALALWIASDEVRDDEAKLALESRILKSITRVAPSTESFPSRAESSWCRPSSRSTPLGTSIRPRPSASLR